MPLLAEYGLIPDVFDTTCYTNAALCGIHLQNLKEALLTDGIVRNFRDGQWFQQFGDNSRPWHQRGQELLRKLRQQNRLRVHAARLPSAPTNDVEWCREALESHAAEPLQGIIATDRTCGQFAGQQIVAPVTNLSGAPWWQNRSPSVRLPRTLAAYRQQLALILACANSVMFIDPHLDPTQPRYQGFIDLLTGAAGRTLVPRLEVHRVCYFDSADKRNQRDEAGWRGVFSSWNDRLRQAGLTVEVFIWDDFHDRYAISDLIGISVSNGFDTTTAPNRTTTWTRLGRNDRDDVQREFDPASGRHQLRARFHLP